MGFTVKLGALASGLASRIGFSAVFSGFGQRGDGVLLDLIQEEIEGRAALVVRGVQEPLEAVRRELWRPALRGPCAGCAA